MKLLVLITTEGLQKKIWGDLNGACADWGKAASLGNQDSAQLANATRPQACHLQ